MTVTTYTSFVSMTKSQARACLEQFLNEMPTCLDRLKDHCAATGGPHESDLDYSAESLDALWSWVAPRFRWRESYTPPASRGELQPQFNPDDLEPPDDLPSWFYHPSGHGLARFSADTLWLIDGIGRYLGQSVIETIPGTRWSVGANKPKGNMLANQPVLDGLGYEVSPLITCAVLASQAVTEWEVTPSLAEAYEQLVSIGNTDQAETGGTAAMNGEVLELLENGELFEVLDHDHPDFSFYVSFDDEIAKEYDEAIDRLAGEVAELPDVLRAVREDREVLLVGGFLSGPTLEAWLADWWRSELRQEPSSERDAASPPSSRSPRRFWLRRRRDS